MATPIGNWESVLSFFLERAEKSNDLSFFRTLSDDYKRIQHLQLNLDLNEIEWLKSYFENCQELHKKSEDRATSERMNGNKLFQRKQYKKAVDAYTEAIVHSPRQSQELALAFGNRSAAWFHLGEFQSSVVDISQAVKNGYPESTQYKLDIRQAHAHYQLGNLEETSEALEKFSKGVTDNRILSEKKKEVLQRDAESLKTKLPKTQCTSQSSIEEDSQLPIVSYGPNAVLIQSSAAVSLMYNDSQGRFLVGNRDLKRGDTLIVERPFAAILLPEHYTIHCHHCYASLKSVFPCRQCTMVKYCSPECEEESWSVYHDIECSYLDLLHSVGIAHLSLRIVLVAGLKFLTEFKQTEGRVRRVGRIPGLTEDGQYDRNYLSVYDLMTHTDDMDTADLYQYSVTAVLLLRILQHANWFDRDGSSKSVFFDKCCSKNSNQSHNSCSFENTTVHRRHDNSHEENRKENGRYVDKEVERCESMTTALSDIDINDVKNTEKQSHSECSHCVLQTTNCISPRNVLSGLHDDEIYIGGLLLRHIQQLVCNAHAITAMKVTEARQNTLIEETSQVRVATAIYPTASLMNHSCDPTIISSFYKDILIVRAVKEVKPGEEIFNCYGPHHKRMKRNERQQVLHDQYFFSCTCKPCINAAEDDLIYSSYRCHRCNGPFCKKNEILTCKDCHYIDRGHNMEEKFQKTVDLFSEGLNLIQHQQYRDATTIMTSCYKMRKELLYKNNSVLAETQDCLARCYAMSGQFKKASKYLRESLETVKVIYGAESIELANELRKLSEVLISAHEWKQALEVTRDAIALFTLHYGDLHASVIELSKAQADLKDLL